MIFGGEAVGAVLLLLLTLLISLPSLGLLLWRRLQRTRRQHRGQALPPRRAAYLLPALGCLPLALMLILAARGAYIDHASHPTLTAPRQVGDVSLPVGSRLHTSWPHDYLFDAQLPHPIRLRGLSVDAIDFHNLQLRLNRPQTVSGWPCAGGAYVNYQADFNAPEQDPRLTAHWQFTDCTLQSGSLLADARWPAGSSVRQSPDGWTLHNFPWYLGINLPERPADSPRPPVRYRGVWFSDLTLNLDARRQVTGCEGVLAQAARIGGRAQPAGRWLRDEQLLRCQWPIG